jgi:hypothetical protein
MLVTKTLGPDETYDYSSMSAWQAGEQTDLVGDGDYHVLECAAFTYLETVMVDIQGWGTDPDHDITIKPAAGAEHGGVWGESLVLQRASSYNTVIIVTEVHITIEGICIEQINDAAAGHAATFNGADIKVRNCLFRNYSPNGLGITVMNAVLENCRYEQMGTPYASAGLIIPTWSGGGYRNCLCIGAFIGLEKPPNGSKNGILENTVCIGSVDVDFKGLENLTTTPPTNNASSDDTAAGYAGSQTGVGEDDFVDYPNGNYEPAKGGKLAGTGVDLSEFFTDDITGYTRTIPWDIGPYAIQLGASISFIGPDVEDITLVPETPVPNPTPDPSMDERFSYSGGTVTYSLHEGTLPPGVTINPNTGNLVGTPTENGTYPGIIVKGVLEREE